MNWWTENIYQQESCIQVIICMNSNFLNSYIQARKYKFGVQNIDEVKGNQKFVCKEPNCIFYLFITFILNRPWGLLSLVSSYLGNDLTIFHM